MRRLGSVQLGLLTLGAFPHERGQLRVQQVFGAVQRGAQDVIGHLEVACRVTGTVDPQELIGEDARPDVGVAGVRGHGSFSGRESLDRPPARAAVADAVVQPAGPALPELHLVGLEPEPAPVRGQRDVAIGIPFLGLPEVGLEHLA